MTKTEMFIQKAFAKYGDRYNYDKSNYINIDTKIEIHCIEHDTIFYQSPYNHLNGRMGCNRCVETGRKRQSYNASHTTEQFIISAQKTHGNRYDYSKVNYKIVLPLFV